MVEWELGYVVSFLFVYQATMESSDSLISAPVDGLVSEGVPRPKPLHG